MSDGLPGFELFFVSVYKGNNVVGGTASGKNFVSKIASYIPHTFVGYISSLHGKIYYHYMLLLN